MAGLRNSNPLSLHDHAIQEHNAWITRPMFATTGLAAGYDPYFMAGYAKSLHSSPSSTLYEVVGCLTGGVSPAVVYKVVVLIGFAALPWLIAASGAMLRLGGPHVTAAVALFLVYIWSEGGGGGFPLNYALIGMTAYLLVVPLGLLATAAVVRFLAAGGFGRWAGATLLLALGFLVHITSVLSLGAAVIGACLALPRETNRRGSRLLATLWLAPISVLVLNWFWVLPAMWLRKTRAPGPAFLSHSSAIDSVGWRLAKIVLREPPFQAVVLGVGLVGLVALWRRDRTGAAALGSFAGSGFAFGYLAGWFPALDVVQPGRQTHALYAAACLLAGFGVAEIGTSLRKVGGRWSLFAWLAALALIGSRNFGTSLDQTIRTRLGISSENRTRPFLTSDPRPGFTEIVKTIRSITKPGERIFYEEYGITVPGEPDPFAGGRFSGLLPQLAGVEVVGGPYLHVGLDTNFSQIGEGKFFGNKGWDRDAFLRYARIYRPSGIVCFSVEARNFCLMNPDLVRVTYKSDRLLIGRVVGFEGPSIRGKANVLAMPGRLEVSGIIPDLDGLVVLRYHVVPGMRCRPAMPIVPILLEDDPVPFLGLRPGPGQTETKLDIGFPPGR